MATTPRMLNPNAAKTHINPTLMTDTRGVCNARASFRKPDGVNGCNRVGRGAAICVNSSFLLLTVRFWLRGPRPAPACRGSTVIARQIPFRLQRPDNLIRNWSSRTAA